MTEWVLLKSLLNLNLMTIPFNPRFLPIAALLAAAVLFAGGCASDATDEATPAAAGADAPATIEPQYLDEIDALAETPIVRQAFDEIMALEPRTQDELIMLTEIPAPPFQEERRANKYRAMLQAAGADGGAGHATDWHAEGVRTAGGGGRRRLGGHRFLGFATLLLSALSAVGVIYVALTLIFIETCQ